MRYIYKITNKINGKFYIGQAIDIYHRFQTHYWVHGDHHNSAIDSAIDKYGLENFEIEILEECPEEKLNEREIYWGEEYYNGKCYVPNGYNLALLGGRQINITACKPVSQYDLNGNLIKTYLSYAAAARAMNVSSQAIRQAIYRENSTCKNYLWADGNELKIASYQKISTGNKVLAYDSNKQIKLIFSSQAEAAEYFKITPTAIMYYLNHKSGYVCCQGYYLARENEEPIIRQRYKQTNTTLGRKIYQYDLNTHKLIAEYNQIKSVCEKYGCDSKGIRNVANGVQNQSIGYIWSYQKYDIIPENYRELNKRNKELSKGNVL